MRIATITKLNTRGEGVSAELPPMPNALPGEQVDAQGRIVTPSPDRVRPPCPHFKSCGGCAMQHARDAFVAEWKGDVIRQGLAGRGIETDIRPIMTSPPASRRRAVLHGRRTKKGAMIGFHARGSDTLIEGPECTLLMPEVLAARPILEQLTQTYASRKAEVSFAVTLSAAGLDVDMRGAKPLDAAQIAELAHFASQNGIARISCEGEAVAMHHPPAQKFGTVDVVPPPGAFLQATRHGQEVLTSCVTDILSTARRVVDLFAGCGTFTLPAAQSAEIWALEGDAALIRALDTGWRHARGLKHVQAETRDLFRRPVLAAEFARYDAIIIDPPRAGAEAQSHEIAKSGVPVIAAISCNPVSFARDAEILIDGGYRLDWVQPVDQFRWSAHVELAAQFTRPHMQRK